MVDGLLAFSHGFAGEVWLEVFVLRGLTDGPGEIGRIAAIVGRLRPARVQLNTVARPPTETDAHTVRAYSLGRLCGRFPAPCEVIAERRIEPARGAGAGDVQQEIVELLSRRPCTVEGIADGLGLRPNEVLKHLEVLCDRGTVRSERRGNALFYEASRGS